MLGRRVYRVRPLETGGWTIEKEGESGERGRRASERDAVAWAEELAAGDEPSRLVIEGTGGVIVTERLFGKDDASALDDRSPLAGKKA
jgi:hypothetical protein